MAIKNFMLVMISVSLSFLEHILVR